MQNNVVNKKTEKIAINANDATVVKEDGEKKVVKKESENSEKKSSALSEKLSNIGFIKKIRSIKHIEYIIAIILIGILLLIFFGNFNLGSGNDSKTSESTNANYVTVDQYTASVQNELEGILSKIKGAGNVSVMITFESSAEKVPAYSLEETKDKKSESNGDRQTDSSNSKTIQKPIVINGEVLILKELKPTIKGVIIVAAGANDSKVKYELKNATKTLLDISYEKIEIFTMK